MNFSVLTYNVLYNEALNSLGKIIEEFQPDILCLQEIDTSEKNLNSIEKYGYKLADYSNSFIKFGKIFGIATFYSEKKMTLVNSTVVQLPRNIYEIILHIIRLLRGGNAPRTMLNTEFMLKKKRKKVAVYTTHLTAYGTNEARIKQIKKILNVAHKYSNLPLLIAGDLNYIPYRRKRLERLINIYGLHEATSSINYTTRITRDGKFEKFNFFQKAIIRLAYFLKKNQFKSDYIFYKNLQLKKIIRIEVCFSDHFPIFATFQM